MYPSMFSDEFTTCCLKYSPPLILLSTREKRIFSSIFELNFRYMTTMGEGWTAFRLQRLGQWNEANTQVFPRTTEIIRGLNIPLAVRGVMFAKQVNFIN